jgi:monothiol bacilliredoxin
MIPLQRLRTAADLDRALDVSREKDVLLFKHSTRCSISAGAHDEIEEFLREPAAARFAAFLLDVVADRATSLEVATRLGVRHESPQVLVVRDGAVVAHDSHGGIDRSFLRGLAPR